jgi:hypothetical protein
VNNCGSCGTRCGGGFKCEGGGCKLICNKTTCGNACVDTSTDVNNCGSCGTRCGGGFKCEGGGCKLICNKTTCGNACVDTSTDVSNCGSCGTRCGGGFKCEGGGCKLICNKTTCGNACVDTSSDNNNCGSCGQKCTSGFKCGGGTCNSVAIPCNPSCKTTPHCDGAFSVVKETCDTTKGECRVQPVETCGPGSICYDGATKCAPMCSCSNTLHCQSNDIIRFSICDQATGFCKPQTVETCRAAGCTDSPTPHCL